MSNTPQTTEHLEQISKPVSSLTPRDLFEISMSDPMTFFSEKHDCYMSAFFHVLDVDLFPGTISEVTHDAFLQKMREAAELYLKTHPKSAEG